MSAFWVSLTLWVFLSGLYQLPRQVAFVVRLFRGRGDQ